MEPKVSILIPAYNAERWISEAIESALAQTWTCKEIIVVDDGSTDHTLQVAKQFQARNVRVVTQPNQGASTARNTAFASCQGDYIQWLDADDILEKDKVEQQIRALTSCLSPRTLLSGAWASFMYRKQKARFSPSPLWTDLTPTEWLVRKMGQNLQMQTDNWLVSRELSEAAGPWDPRLWRDNDGEYFCRVIRASDGIAFVPEAKSYYRSAGFNSISYIAGSNKKLDSLFLSTKLHVTYLLSLENSARTRRACVNYLQAKAFQFYPNRYDIIGQIRQLISELDGEYYEPILSWKYNWIMKLFGWTVARRVQVGLPRLKGSARIAWDRAMFHIERRTGHQVP
jgi:glycosyltransferase involved in cell wall biosynthesis